MKKTKISVSKSKPSPPKAAVAGKKRMPAETLLQDNLHNLL